MPGTKTCHSWNDYELGPRESKRRSGKRLRTIRNLFRTACSGDGRRERKHTHTPKKEKKKKPNELWTFYERFTHPYIWLCNTGNLARNLNLTIQTSGIFTTRNPADYRIKLKESKKRDMYLDFGRDLKKIMAHDSDGDTNCNWCVLYSHQTNDTGTRGLGYRRRSGCHPNYSRLTRILRGVKETWGDFLSLKLQSKPWQLLVRKTLKRKK